MRNDANQRFAAAFADRKPSTGHIGRALRPMAERDIRSVVGLIARAMNPDEGDQAENTFRFHFSCKNHGIKDGRHYYVLTHDSAITGVAGLHHYIWGPPENVWLAWFALEPGCHGRGLGTLLLDAVIRQAKSRGYKTLFVETYSTPEFARAREFYRAKGFTQAGGIQAYLANAGDMVVFSKDLTNHV